MTASGVSPQVPSTIFVCFVLFEQVSLNGLTLPSQSCSYKHMPLCPAFDVGARV